MASLAAPLFPAWGADSLGVTYDGDNLHVSAADLHFVTGKTLQRLKDGAEVAYVAQLTLFYDRFVTPFKRKETRFLVSYDIWGEDKFAVTMPGPSPLSAKDLSAPGMEAWCLGNVWITAAGIRADREFWLQFEMVSGSPKELSRVLGDSGISVDLIDLFSRLPASDNRLTLQAGPLRLADLTRTPGRGRNG